MFSFLSLVITIIVVKFFANYFIHMNSSKQYHKNFNRKKYRKKKTLEDLRKDKSNTKLSSNKSNNSQYNQNNIDNFEQTNNRKENQKLIDKDFFEEKNNELELIRVEINDEFKHKDELKKAIIMKEIIDKPLSLRNRR
ncbi:MAG: hypothetical protein E7J43_01505 [Finegoldia magna]|uniref:hypothetical protein n=1 Tax=Finegoldia magna TaxID=1260 RepID=UPI000B91A527|nr:hypothetical protein [Finegoldia magna]MDU1009970.1 hypothetical protein [Finegoldia magna]MDU1087150.1 hypothetical protein [Finegoldia magna]MDU7889636.1 hypothetical protein [Finegoldia magna]MDU7925560.1 hypothetical protein [Finegoldia magna]OXZ38673.1 hypothetical protein B9N50_04285 [Finegoldia magna]